MVCYFAHFEQSLKGLSSRSEKAISENMQIHALLQEMPLQADLLAKGGSAWRVEAGLIDQRR